jgi:hypothetical protein
MQTDLNLTADVAPAHAGAPDHGCVVIQQPPRSQLLTCRIAADGTFLHANVSFCTFWSYSLDQLLHRSSLLLLQHDGVQDEPLAEVVSLFKTLRATRDTEPAPYFNYGWSSTGVRRHYFGIVTYMPSSDEYACLLGPRDRVPELPASTLRVVEDSPHTETQEMLNVLRLQASAIDRLTRGDKVFESVKSLERRLSLDRSQAAAPTRRRYEPQEKCLRTWEGFRARKQELEAAARREFHVKREAVVTKEQVHLAGGLSPRTITRIMTLTYGLRADDWPPSTWPEQQPPPQPSRVKRV